MTSPDRRCRRQASDEPSRPLPRILAVRPVRLKSLSARPTDLPIRSLDNNFSILELYMALKGVTEEQAPIDIAASHYAATSQPAEVGRIDLMERSQPTSSPRQLSLAQQAVIEGTFNGRFACSEDAVENYVENGFCTTSECVHSIWSSNSGSGDDRMYVSGDTMKALFSCRRNRNGSEGGFTMHEYAEWGGMFYHTFLTVGLSENYYHMFFTSEDNAFRLTSNNNDACGVRRYVHAGMNRSDTGVCHNFGHGFCFVQFVDGGYDEIADKK